MAAELDEELQERPDLLEDIALIRDQTERCRAILRDMGRAGRDDALMQFVAYETLISEAAEPHLDRGKDVIFRINGVPAAEEMQVGPQIPRKPEILHGARNLVQNAVDFAQTRVWIDVSWTDTRLSLEIGDDGPGFSEDLRGRIGDPFLRGRSSSAQQTARPGYEGMGLGLFIAKTLLERSRGTIKFENGHKGRTRKNPAEDPAQAMPPGAIVKVTWPRSALEAPRDRVRGPLGRNRLNRP